MNYRNSSIKAIKNSMNKQVRKLNKNLREDDLFPNRFKIQEASHDYIPYEDGSGYSLAVVYEIQDLKCGNRGLFAVGNHGYAGKIWNYANDFVIRCRDGVPGHTPILPWITVEINKVEA